MKRLCLAILSLILLLQPQSILALEYEEPIEEIDNLEEEEDQEEEEPIEDPKEDPIEDPVLIAGENWNLTEGGVLTVLKDYIYEDYMIQPWEEYIDSIHTLVIEEGTTTLGAGAFMNLPSLEKVTLPDTLEWIGDGCFQNDESLVEINIPEGIVELPDDLFAGCCLLTTIQLPDSLERIGNYAFSSCTSLINITIPESVFSIGDGVFMRCIALQTVTLPKYLEALNSALFQGDTDLLEVVLPEKVDDPILGSACFSGCSLLTAVTLPDTITRIESFAFESCSSLVEINGLGSIEYLGSQVFNNTSYLTSLMNSDLEYLGIGKVFVMPNSTVTGSYTLPEGYTSIASEAFASNNRITEIIIPEGYQSIGTYAFYDCKNLQAVSLPNTLESIEVMAFYSCHALNKVYAKKGLTTIEYASLGVSYDSNYNLVPDSNLVIFGYKGTELENYANEMGITFVDQLPFTDLDESKWYYPIVQDIYISNLMTGTSPTTFSPYQEMSRGMVATVLYRLSGSQEVEYKGIFPDVADGKYYSKAITWCYENGIIKGNGDGTFAPSKSITRQELAVMLCNYMKYLGYNIESNLTLDQFEDASQVSTWAYPSIIWAVDQGIITGKTINEKLYIDPKANATRSECAKMLYEVYKLI